MAGGGGQTPPLATDFLKFVGKVAAEPGAEGNVHAPPDMWIVAGDQAEEFNPMVPRTPGLILNIEPKPPRSRTR